MRVLVAAQHAGREQEDRWASAAVAVRARRLGKPVDSGPGAEQESRACLRDVAEELPNTIAQREN